MCDERKVFNFYSFSWHLILINKPFTFLPISEVLFWFWLFFRAAICVLYQRQNLNRQYNKKQQTNNNKHTHLRPNRIWKKYENIYLVKWIVSNFLYPQFFKVEWKSGVFERKLCLLFFVFCWKLHLAAFRFIYFPVTNSVHVLFGFICAFDTTDIYGLTFSICSKHKKSIFFFFIFILPFDWFGRCRIIKVGYFVEREKKNRQEFGRNNNDSRVENVLKVTVIRDINLISNRKWCTAIFVCRFSVSMLASVTTIHCFRRFWFAL